MESFSPDLALTKVVARLNTQPDVVESWEINLSTIQTLLDSELFAL